MITLGSDGASSKKFVTLSWDDNHVFFTGKLGHFCYGVATCCCLCEGTARDDCCEICACEFTMPDLTP